MSIDRKTIRDRIRELDGLIAGQESRISTGGQGAFGAAVSFVGLSSERSALVTVLNAIMADGAVEKSATRE